MIIYNKLIRDRIPEIIKDDNKLCEVRILDNSEFSREVYRKLLEEMTELSNASSRDEIINEMADIHELLDTLRDIHNIHLNEVLTKQISKGLTNGKFERKLFLISVGEKEWIYEWIHSTLAFSNRTNEQW